MKLTFSNILRLDFKIFKITNYEETIKKLKSFYGGNIVRILGNCVFILNTTVYDYHLDGEIDLKIQIFKCVTDYGKHRWVCMLNKTDLLEVKNVKDVLDLSNNINYKESVGFTYIIKSDNGYKIGSSKNIKERSKLFGVLLPLDWKYEKIFILEEYKQFEKFLHKVYKKERLNGEWFDLKDGDIQNIMICKKLFN